MVCIRLRGDGGIRRVLRCMAAVSFGLSAGCGNYDIVFVGEGRPQQFAYATCDVSASEAVFPLPYRLGVDELKIIWYNVM